ncbi:GntR family transcriptional regulator [Ornithinicoccus hortensis]|uniref:DNA-binding GntR family transcriptional regulator n=1 Tax=Ornithinicoccus hortensis TaxID=82346 RepID=A0A542YW45_9MICO|nr:GntR family transcriptional regulator [Ornithinicoccus hortensis]TQL52301.1 DNA-binding GntR family transcriptional regulator [Ornithinicoccus hortensis]
MVSNDEVRPAGLTVDLTARVGDQVFRALRTAIVNGELPEGYRLRIRDLADELGTSVMPVREAIRRLEEIGLAEAVPYRGAVVKQLTGEELLNIYGVRRLLEVEAARAGVPHVDGATLEAAESEFTALELAITEQRAVDYLDRDEALLTLLYGASGNPVLVETITALWLRCRNYKIVGATQELTAGHPENLSLYQRQLLDAVASGDADAAGEVTAASIDAAIERIRTAFAG